MTRNDAPTANDDDDKTHHKNEKTSGGFFTQFDPWADLSAADRSTHLTMTLVFFLTVGGYWLVRPMKMGVYVALVGLEYEPWAKIGTVFILVPVLMGYNKLVQMFDSPPRLVMYVGGFYAFFFVGVSIGLSIPGIGFGGQATPLNWLGWVTYWTIESYGSVCVAMMWSVMSTLANQRTATVVYPVIVIVNQLGAVAGATGATYTSTFGFSTLFFVEAINVLLGVFLVLSVFRNRPGENEAPVIDVEGGQAGFVEKKKEKVKEAEPGLMDGLSLIIQHRYVAYIAVVSTFQEIVGTIMDFQMKMIAKREYSDPAEFSVFMGRFGQAVNVVSLIFALTGTKKFIEYFGLRFCLITYPAVTLVVTAGVFFFPSLQIVFYGMVALKALGYALNNPAKEILYLRTSKDIKFKAKSWIDMFGTRGAKAAGSLVNQYFKSSVEQLLSSGSVVGSLFVFFWLSIAKSVGTVHEELVRDNRFIGEVPESAKERAVM